MPKCVFLVPPPLVPKCLRILSSQVSGRKRAVLNGTLISYIYEKGIGSITIVDDKIVDKCDIQSNFFLEPSDISNPKAEAVVNLLKELNEAVTTQFVKKVRRIRPHVRGVRVPFNPLMISSFHCSRPMTWSSKNHHFSTLSPWLWHLIYMNKICLNWPSCVMLAKRSWSPFLVKAYAAHSGSRHLNIPSSKPTLKTQVIFDWHAPFPNWWTISTHMMIWTLWIKQIMPMFPSLSCSCSL